MVAETVVGEVVVATNVPSEEGLLEELMRRNWRAVSVCPFVAGGRKGADLRKHDSAVRLVVLPDFLKPVRERKKKGVVSQSRRWGGKQDVAEGGSLFL